MNFTDIQIVNLGRGKTAIKGTMNIYDDVESPQKVCENLFFMFSVPLKHKTVLLNKMTIPFVKLIKCHPF